MQNKTYCHDLHKYLNLWLHYTGYLEMGAKQHNSVIARRRRSNPAGNLTIGAWIAVIFAALAKTGV